MKNKKQIIGIVAILVLFVLAIAVSILGEKKEADIKAPDKVATALDAIKDEQESDKSRIKSEKNTVISEKMYKALDDEMVKLLENKAKIEKSDNGYIITTEYIDDRTTVKDGIKDNIDIKKAELNSAGIQINANVADGTITVSGQTTGDADKNIKDIAVLMGLYQKISSEGSDWLVIVNTTDDISSTTTMYVALALAIRRKNDNRDVFIETGLPSSYMNDSDALKKAICKPAEFEIKRGSGEWESYKLEFTDNQIDVIPQPSGALYSVMTKSDGQFIDNVKEIIAGNTLIMDIGFGTFDFYGLKNRMIECKDSSDEIGMRKVLESTSKKILDDTGEEIRVASMQRKLEEGKFEAVNEDDLTSETKSISPYLEKATDEVFNEAMNKAKSVTNSFRGYNNLIISGGTGEAWFDKIKDRLKGMKTLKVIPANINDHEPLIYAVARGYYLYCYRILEMKK